jgi:hypothetical protein
MNWRFGFSLGRTEFDGQIYGAASAAADCMKALVPFFFFAAIRNRMWSQAVASALVWVVVMAYSLTSALGHAALNRSDTTGQRAATVATYKDQRADLARAKEQLSWIPQHRPAQTVQSDIDAAKNERAWAWTKGCTEVSGAKGRGFCQKYHALTAEFASAEQSTALEKRIAEIEQKIAQSGGSAVVAEADPQAAVLAQLANFLMLPLKVEDVQTGLAVFIALLLEVGSAFGMYIAFSQWRLYDTRTPVAPRMVPVSTAATALPVQKPVALAKPRSTANDNRTAPARLMAPETDVQRFYKERIESQDGSTIGATEMFEDYCTWCEKLGKEPLAHPNFGREFQELGVQKAKVAGRVRYIGIALKSESGLEADKKSVALQAAAA